ncbi:MAG: hypothetical protein JWQ97_382 [Phenylobacterium sp.]|nr:hypothetical protein [Phenylobacterium sp.]
MIVDVDRADVAHAPSPHALDLARVGRIAAIPVILNLVLESTGLRFGAVAKVTSSSWTALAVLDRIDFGLRAGGELEVSTTLCSEIRTTRAPVVIGCASRDPHYCGHATPRIYGFESYVAVPIILRSGEVFGTICALDPEPRDLSDPKILSTTQLFADLIAAELELDVKFAEQEAALAHQKLLIHELNHRVKNTLTTIQSLAAQSFRGAQRVDQALERFEDRLMAIAGVHDVLTQASWSAVELREVIRRATAPFVGLPARFSIAGPELSLLPRLAVPISMALHELLTNAVKYGALSASEGRVAVSWSVDHRQGDDWLTLHWTESGGPPVTPPATPGFGTRLIQRGLARELAGSVSLEFAPDGVRCCLQAPLT